jgi:SAM-dependent methyltransferase
MSVFGAYARYYDLLYRDKDYAAEAQYVHRLIQSHALGARSILELGCGTGAHAVLLAGEGYRIHGVDLSTEMLELAEARLAEMSPEQASRVEFSQGDIRTVRLNSKFDAVISLFDVISYQTTNEDLKATFATVKAHLKPGGVFIFDCWYGPAVLNHRPAARVKRVEDEEVAVTRIAEPVIYPNENCVDVNYQLFIKDKASGTVEELRECHRMRYLFTPEVELLLGQTGFRLLHNEEWMTGKALGFDTWGACYVAEVAPGHG